MEKKINYIARDFNSIRNELVNFAQKYYPELATDYNDSSVGSLMLDLASAVGDDLSFHTDRIFQETNINSANSRSSLLNIARSNGLKVPGKVASMVEVKISCVLPIDSKNNMSQPDWSCAPFLRRGTLVSAGDIIYELVEDCNFKEQFNADAFSNREFTPNRDANKGITGYKVTKTVLATNGVTRIFRRTITNSMLEPFMEVILPEKDVMNIESIIFKETSTYNLSPEAYEYYIPEEVYTVKNEGIRTFRYFETDALVDQYRFSSSMKGDIANKFQPEAYLDYVRQNNGVSDTIRIYPGVWKPLKQKFITEYTDNGYMKIIFGSGNNENVSYDGNTKYGEYALSRIVNNNQLGVLPSAGWTMFVRYYVGGGQATNLGQGAINGIALANAEFENEAIEPQVRSSIVNSIRVTNTSNAVAGRNEPSEEELKYLIKYNSGAQNRCVTVKDYRIKLLQMPPKYGAPYRSQVIETNNKIEMSLLGLDASGRLDSVLPMTLVENIINYMGNYKTIGDYIEIKSGRIYNLGFTIDVYVDKNYTTANIVSNIIEKVQSYFDVDKHNMGEDIFVGDLEKEITLLDGVLSLINVDIYKLYGGKYSPDQSTLPIKIGGTQCNPIQDVFKVDSGTAEAIDLDATGKILYSDYNSMFEILYPTSDIQVRVKLK